MCEMSNRLPVNEKKKCKTKKVQFYSLVSTGGVVFISYLISIFAYVVLHFVQIHE